MHKPPPLDSVACPNTALLRGALSTARHFHLPVHRFGRVQSVIGLIVEASCVGAAVGELCYIYENEPGGRRVAAEVVGVRGNTTLLMPLEPTTGLRSGGLVERSTLPLTVEAGDALLGRVVDSNGHPIDNLGPIRGAERVPVHNEPPSPLSRAMITSRLETGVRAIDAFVSLGKGQRIGIFSGSGIGKSTLLGMIARNAKADVNVIALIGERSREVQEFIVDNLGAEGLRRSVVVAVTGDQAAMRRVKGATVACAIAEHFRNQGKDVLLMMDSITRVAMAQREIGLAVGEPPTTRGYTPSVFALLPRLLERAGTGLRGTITGIFTVLVDGDDMNEPVGDAVRSILDGHIVLSRTLANAGHFPAIDVLQSVSRTAHRICDEAHTTATQSIRKILAAYRDAEDLIRIGAYVAGSDSDTDRAIALKDDLTRFLVQGIDEPATPDQFDRLVARVVAWVPPELALAPQPKLTRLNPAKTRASA
jgi:flagellum-specific ATP synthase